MPENAIPFPLLQQTAIVEVFRNLNENWTRTGEQEAVASSSSSACYIKPPHMKKALLNITMTTFVAT